MKIRAPFIIHQIECRDPAQATHTKWFVAGLSLHRYWAYGYPQSVPRWQYEWEYVLQHYLGSMLLSLPFYTYVWRLL